MKEDVVGQVCPVVIQSGDDVLIFFHGDMDAKTAHALSDHLTSQLPGIQFTIVDKVAAVLVRRDPDA